MKRFSKAFGFLTIATGLSAALGFFTQTLFARSLGVETFGELSAYLALITIVGCTAGFGIDNCLLKLHGKGKYYAARHSKAVISYLVISTCLSFIFLVAFLFFFSKDNNSFNYKNVIYLSPVILSLAIFNIVSAHFQVTARFGGLAIWQVFNSFLKFLVAVVIFLGIIHQSNIFLAYGAFISILSIAGIPFIMDLWGERRSSPELACNSKSISRVVKVSVPFGIASIAHIIYFQSDVFMLSALKGAEVAGFYSAAFNILLACYLIPQIAFQKILLPSMHKWAHSDKRKLNKAIKSSGAIMLIFGVVVSCLLWLFSEEIIVNIYGNEYKKSTSILMFMLICIPIRFLTGVFGALLSTGNFLKPKIKVMLFVAVFNLITNFLFIPIYGVWAAVITTIFSETLLLLLFYYISALKVYNKVIKIKF